LERHGEPTARNLLNLRQASDAAWIHALKTERPSIQTATQNESCKAIVRAALLLEKRLRRLEWGLIQSGDERRTLRNAIRLLEEVLRAREQGAKEQHGSRAVAGVKFSRKTVSKRYQTFRAKAEGRFHGGQNSRSAEGVPSLPDSDTVLPF